jgi:hypothetical protein
MKKWTIFGMVIVIALAFIMTGCGGSDNDDTEEGAEAKAEETTPQEPDITVSVGEILQEFDDNELAADEKYKDKVIAVTGIVSKVDTDMWDDDEYILNIKEDENSWTDVSCYGLGNDVLSTLIPGDTVTVIGTFKDGGDLGIQLSDCQLVGSLTKSEKEEAINSWKEVMWEEMTMEDFMKGIMVFDPEWKSLSNGDVQVSGNISSMIIDPDNWGSLDSPEFVLTFAQLGKSSEKVEMISTLDGKELDSGETGEKLEEWYSNLSAQ